MWGLYLWSDVEGTREQMAWQMNGRGVSVSQPLLTLSRELREKYWELYAGWRPGVPLAMRLKMLFCLLGLPRWSSCFLTWSFVDNALSAYSSGS